MFHVGQKVVCVDDAPHGTEPCRDYGIIRGNVYTIRDVFSCLVSNEVGLRLEEIVLPMNPHLDLEYMFRTRRFRPVVEKKTDTGMAILKEILERETINDRAPART